MHDIINMPKIQRDECKWNSALRWIDGSINTMGIFKVMELFFMKCTAEEYIGLYTVIKTQTHIFHKA
jgi:hypothetical protein